MAKMDLNKIVVVLCLAIGNAAALRCYVCGFSSSESDHSCLTITNSTVVIDCEHTFCTIMRQDFLDPRGAVVSFVRSCEREPVFLNHDITDENYVTYYRACTSDLCNAGDGIHSVVGGNLSPEPVYTGENLLVPGTGSNASHQTVCLLLLVISILVILTLNNSN